MLLPQKCFLILASYLHLTLKSVLALSHCDRLHYVSFYPISTYFNLSYFPQSKYIYEFCSLKAFIVFTSCKTKSIILILAYQTLYKWAKQTLLSCQLLTHTIQKAFLCQHGMPSYDVYWLIQISFFILFLTCSSHSSSGPQIDQCLIREVFPASHIHHQL